MRQTRAVSIFATFTFCASVLGCVGASQAQGVVLDGSDPGRVFEGIGAASAGASSRLLIDYPEPQRSEILDYLFKPGYGAALQHLKVEVGSDSNSTDGSEPSSMRSPDDHNYTRGYEWWLMEEAKKRNPNIILDVLPWGAPGWVGDGHLYSQDMADYMTDFIVGAQKAHNLKIDYVGIWNERMYDSNYVKTLAASLHKAGLQTKIVCCDSTPGQEYGQWSIVDAITANPELRQAVAAIGVHYPNDTTGETPESAKRLGIPLWASEDQPNGGGGPFLSRGWDFGGKTLAKQYISNYLDKGLTKTEIWSPITSYYDILAAPNSGLMYANTPWSGHYEVQSTIWATAHTTQFTQPGWRYIDRASGRSGRSSYVTLHAPTGNDWSIVLETVDEDTSRIMHFSVHKNLSQGEVHIWQTDATHNLVKVADVPQRSGGFSYEFAPGALYTVTTTTGQDAHSGSIPEAHAFPMPYGDDFEKVEVGRTPKYLSDQDGAFEAEPCTGRPGRCLVQQITRTPIAWAAGPAPFTMAGGMEARDYSVHSDVFIPANGAVTLMGRIDSADNFKDNAAIFPSGYVLNLRGDGHWQLLSTNYNKRTSVLAEGVTTVLAGQWHTTSLSFRETVVTAMVDGKPLAQVSNREHLSGFFALGSTWDHAQFDNLGVDRP